MKKPDKFRLTFLAGDDQTEHQHTGHEFGETAVALVNDVMGCYGDVAPELFKALSVVGGGGEVREFDFSVPEDQFTLTCEVLGKNGEWEKPSSAAGEIISSDLLHACKSLASLLKDLHGDTLKSATLDKANLIIAKAEAASA